MTAAVLAIPAAPLAQDATPPPFEPCPVADLDPPPARPTQPDPPRELPGSREIGGAGLVTEGLTLPPDAPDLPDVITATSWLVADVDSGAVLGACGPHEHGIPASTLKLLLALTLLDHLDPEEIVEVTAEDLDFDLTSSWVGLQVGGEYPVETLWLGLLLDSGNDAANVLARIGGGEEQVQGTLAAMNNTARRLGAHRTHAATPSGLDGPGQVTTAYDLALIARALWSRDDFVGYTTTERAEIPAQSSPDRPSFEIQNNNPLLFNYQGALGGKTGFTSLARHSYVGVAERDGRRLVVTLLGAEAQPVRPWQQGAALLDWGFSLPRAASVGRLVEPGESLSLAAPLDTEPGPVGRGETTTDALPPGQLAAVRTAWAVAGVALVVFVSALLLLLAGAIRARRR